MDRLGLNAALDGRPDTERRRILLEYLHELTIEARDVDETRGLKGLAEVMHTLTGALLLANNGESFMVEAAVVDKGAIYKVGSNLQRAWRRLAQRKGY